MSNTVRRRVSQPRFRQLLLGFAAALCAIVPTTSSLRAQEAPTPPPVKIDDDGTVHAPAMTVPVSGFLSPEGKAYVTQHLKDMQNPAVLGQKDGVPVFMEGYLARQKALFPVDKQDTTVAGVHAYIYTPRAGV